MPDRPFLQFMSLKIVKFSVFLDCRATDKEVPKLWKGRLGDIKETVLERADFWAGCSELSWSGRAQPILV